MDRVFKFYLLYLIVLGFVVALSGISVLKAVLLAVGMTSTLILSYLLILDYYKGSFIDGAEELDCNVLDYKLRIVCKLLGVKVYVINETSLFNVVAIPSTFSNRKPVILITRFVKRILPLDGVIAHEIGHIVKKHHLKMVLLTITVVVAHTVTVSVARAFAGVFASVLLFPVSSVVLTRFLAVVHRNFEFEADKVAMRIVGEGKILESLRKTKLIVGSGKTGLFDTHPSVDDRIKNIEITKLIDWKS